MIKIFQMLCLLKCIGAKQRILILVAWKSNGVTCQLSTNWLSVTDYLLQTLVCYIFVFVVTLLLCTWASVWHVRSRAMRKQVEGPKYMVAKEARPWLGPRVQDDFWNFYLLEWLKTYSFWISKILIKKRVWSPLKQV